jgi:hypothetical protein
MSRSGDFCDKLARRVRAALLREWDPIGVQHYPEVQDEYNAYVPDICSLLINRDSQAEVSRICGGWRQSTSAYRATSSERSHSRCGRRRSRGKQTRTECVGSSTGVPFRPKQTARGTACP